MATEGYQYAYNGTQSPAEIVKTGINNCLDFTLTGAFTWTQSKPNLTLLR